MNGDLTLNGIVPSYSPYLEAAAPAERVQDVTALAQTGSGPGNVEATASNGRVADRHGEQPVRAGCRQRAIATLTGVRNIINDIAIFSEVEAADVTDLAQTALVGYALIPDDSDVRLDASDGTITLTGHVQNWAQHDTAIGAAWKGLGIRNVRDDLVVSG